MKAIRTIDTKEWVSMIYPNCPQEKPYFKKRRGPDCDNGWDDITTEQLKRLLHRFDTSNIELVDVEVVVKSDMVNPITEDVEKAVVSIINRHWSFDPNQVHTHSWHGKQDCLEEIRAYFKSYIGGQMTQREKAIEQALKYFNANKAHIKFRDEAVVIICYLMTDFAIDYAKEQNTELNECVVQLNNELSECRLKLLRAKEREREAFEAARETQKFLPDGIGHVYRQKYPTFEHYEKKKEQE